MEVKWPNVFIFAFLILSIILILKTPEIFQAIGQRIACIGPDHPPEEQLKAFIVFGLMLVTIVAIIKILTQKRK